MAKEQPPGQDDDNTLSKQEEAKESAQMGYFTKLRMGYNKFAAALKSREGERAAVQSRRPMKNTPNDILAAGSSGFDHAGAATANRVTTETDGDQTDGSTDGDGAGEGDGKTGSGGDSGGGPAPAPDAGYVSFADTASVQTQDTKHQAKKNNQVLETLKQAEQKQQAEAPKQTDKKAESKSAAPVAAAPAVTGPAKGPTAGTTGAKGGVAPGGPG
jgi:hypothetical protein